MNRNLGFTLLAYLALTTAYTFWLKHVPIYDIVAVAAGFVLRAVAGATATNVPISEWFFIVTSFGALFMVSGKREGERNLLQGDASSVRATLGVYTAGYLGYLRSVASGVVLVGYCLWVFDSANRSVTDADIWFQLSIVPFVIAILRYALLLDRGEGGEPEKLVMTDRPLLVAGAAWAAFYAIGTYLAEPPPATAGGVGEQGAGARSGRGGVDLGKRPDPRPALVDPGPQGLTVTLVVDHEVRACQAIVAAGLTTDAGPGVGLGESPVLDQPKNRGLRVDIHHNDARHVVSPALHQQRVTDEHVANVAGGARQIGVPIT